MLRQEVARPERIEAPGVFRAYTGGVKSLFRVHEEDGATRSAPFRAPVRTPRVPRPVQQALGMDEVYGLPHQNQRQAGHRGHALDVAPGQ